jgi:dephospho-CoA kinase
MAIIALTGGIGSGKSAAANFFAQLGVPIVDTDVIAHALTKPNQPALLEIAEKMGAEFIDANGALNRAKLRTHVFNHPEAKETLESILHPKIHQEAIRQLAENTKKNVSYQIVVVPLLFEKNQYVDIADQTLAIDCDPALQIVRTMQRSQLDEMAVKAIMAAQVSRDERIALADVVIENNGDLAALYQKVENLHEKWSKTYSKT